MSRYDELHYRLHEMSETLPHLQFKILGSVVHKSKHYDVLRLHVDNQSDTKKIKLCMAFGTHGNEDLTFQSTVEFLKSLLNLSYTNPFFELPHRDERQKLLNHFSITIYFFNPVGFDLNERTNGRRRDQNRWFGKTHAPHEVQLVVRDMENHHFDVCIDLHGDKAAGQFMIYERTRLDASIAEQIIETEKRQKVSIVRDGNHNGEYVKEGVISAPPFAHTFDDYLFFTKGAKVALVFEYAGKDDVVEDIKSILVALYSALKALAKDLPLK